MGGPHAFFPDYQNQTFQFTKEAGQSIKALYVEGVPVGSIDDSTTLSLPSTSRQGPTTQFQLPTRPFALGGPGATPTPRLSDPFRRKQLTAVNLKILQARVVFSATGKPELEKIGQMFTHISDKTATVAHITSVVVEKWGPGHVLVTADCLKIEDSAGTRGKFQVHNISEKVSFYFFLKNIFNMCLQTLYFYKNITSC